MSILTTHNLSLKAGRKKKIPLKVNFSFYSPWKFDLQLTAISLDPAKLDCCCQQLRTTFEATTKYLLRIRHPKSN